MRSLQRIKTSKRGLEKKITDRRSTLQEWRNKHNDAEQSARASTTRNLKKDSAMREQRSHNDTQAHTTYIVYRSIDVPHNT